jgi:hypothetical protein
VFAGTGLAGREEFEALGMSLLDQRRRKSSNEAYYDMEEYE